MTRPSDVDSRQQRAEPPGRSSAGSCQQRRRYRSPRLERYGRLDQITQFNGSQQVDSGGGLGNQPTPFANG
jgi:hypothetical protein